MLRKSKYNLIHAGEEAVFFAIFFQLLYKIPYVYDLDSSIAQQVVEKKPYLKVFSSFFNWLEAKAIQRSIVNLPVCNALANLCEENGSKKTVTLHDISQLENIPSPDTSVIGPLKKEIGIDKLILLYAGNLESYQGIDLLLESFQIVCEQTDKINLVIIGGSQEDINFYTDKAVSLGINKRVHFKGPKPYRHLHMYLAEADLIACPRVRGVNTPMKIFPSLHSGRAVIATDLYTHNQILTNNEAYLAPANREDFARGIIKLVIDEKLRRKLGRNGQAFVEKNHTYRAHKRRLNGAYDWVEEHLSKLKNTTKLHIISLIISKDYIIEYFSTIEFLTF
jgi:glycosyltransferase involved in cell wall biosynthesis